MSKSKYLIKGRLEDVMRLITAMSLSESEFLPLNSVRTALRGEPISINKTWFDIAEEHPEFFRFNGNRDNIALLQRSYGTPAANGHRPPLTINDTQKLIESSMNLYDKARIRSERWFLVLPSIISSVALIIVTIYTVLSSKSDIKEDFNEIQKSIHSIDSTMKIINSKTIKDTVILAPSKIDTSISSPTS